MADVNMPDADRIQQWLAKLKYRDPELHALMSERIAVEPPHAPAFESTGQPEAVPGVPIALETIVREGRPALFIKNNGIVEDDVVIDALARPVVDRLVAARPFLEPVLPLIGRVDVVNHQSGLDFVGTAWLVDEDIVVTNRHVAELIARRGAQGFEFVAGRFGDPITVSLSYARELGGGIVPSVPVIEVVFIEPDPAGPDIAFLRVVRRDGVTGPRFIDLATSDAVPGANVAVVGYPARAPASVIPDQAWMERIYGNRYDVKRVAPGLMDDPSRGWATHDCTTLGGNSGSAVLDMASGKAVGLHFAGLYMVENYAVPASTLRSYYGRKPWPYKLETPAAASASVVTAQPAAQGVTFNLPLTITIAAGKIELAVAGVGTSAATPVQAAQALGETLRGLGVLAVRPGLSVDRDALSGSECLVVSAHPDRIDAVRARAPASYAGLPVEVRPASIDEQLGIDDAVLAEAPGVIKYDDDARTGPDFRLEWIKEPMQLRCHVGPDRGFEELKAFIAGTKTELISSMYQFYADHVRKAVDDALDAPVTMTLVLDPQSRDHEATPPKGQFDRSDTFDAWAETGRFKRIYVPHGNGGLVDNAYHIKVTVRDGDAIWLSSGNWTRTSQPLIAKANRMDPGRVIASGNREWHVVAKSPALAKRYRAHIQQDFKRAGALGGRPESLEQPIFVDVPATALEAVTLEAPPSRVFEPLKVDRAVRVLPLLTPDQHGAVYCDAVLDLIRSARRQLLFQNQYIKVGPATAGRLGTLVDALAHAAENLADCRIILRSDGSGFWDNVAELKRRGINVERQVRRLGATHTKGIVVDGERVLVGSHNWSNSGVSVNRDASLIFDDAEIARYYGEVFEADWARARALTIPDSHADGVGARLATGAEPPPGFVRMPLAAYLEG